MEEAPENGKELSNSAHAIGMNEMNVHVWGGTWLFCNVFFACIWLGSTYKRFKFKQTYYIHFEEGISFHLKFHVQCSWFLGHKVQFHGTPCSTWRWNISWWLNSLHVIGCGGKVQCTHNLITGRSWVVYFTIQLPKLHKIGGSWMVPWPISVWWWRKNFPQCSLSSCSLSCGM